MERLRYFVLAVPLLLGVVLYASIGSSAADRPTGPETTAYAEVEAPEPPLPVLAPSIAFNPETSIANFDGSVVVTQTASSLRWLDGATGDTLHEALLPADSELRAVSGHGDLAATLRAESDRSLITVFDPRLKPRVYEMDGVVEPEAFSTDGALLYVIDHSAAATPGAYRVRPLNLRTGQLGTMVGRLKQPITEEMNGTGSRQHWGANGTMLFTLYIRQTHHHHEIGSDNAKHAHGEPGTDGFVHVLSLDDEWAHCLDLPEQFGRGDLDTTALTVSDDGAELAVLDLNAGQVAFASVEDLAVTNVLDLPETLDPIGQVHLALVEDHVVVGWGSELHWLDRTTLAATDLATQLDTPITALSAADGASVLAWFDDPDQAPMQLTVPSR